MSTDETRSTLFRAAALAAERPPGAVVLARPLSLGLVMLAVAVLVLPLALLAYRGTYTAHGTLVGELVPDLGLVELSAPRAATIVERRVAEGQALAAGQVLYVLSSARVRTDGLAAEASTAAELERRQHSLEQQRRRARMLAAEELETAERIVTALAADRGHLERMLGLTRDRVRLAEDALARYRRLEALGLVSREALEERARALLEQRAALEQLEREADDVSRELERRRAEREALPLKHANQAAELERALAEMRAEHIENEVRARIAVTAPVAGTLTTAVGEIGQVVTAGEVLASIVPRGARLEARLYAPSRAIGFIEVGDPVLLRYDAYPYRRYGQQRGRVVGVSGSTLPAAGAPGVEAIYRVMVSLPAQSFEAGGTARPLRAGMRVEGEVLRETRRLYEWALEPLRRGREPASSR